MISKSTKLTGLFILISFLSVFGQVSTYTFAQFGGTYNSISSTGTKAVGVTGIIDDEVRSNFPIGFNFTFNGATYTAFGLSANGWISMGSGNPVSSTTPISGGTTNNIISAFGRDLQGMNASLNSTLTTGSNTILTTNPAFFAVGDSVYATTGFPTSGAVVTAVSGNSVVTSVNATGASTTAGLRRKGYIYYQTLGAAPNRTLVVEWDRFSRFGTTTVDNLSFQIRLTETSNMVEVMYGVCTTTTTANNTCQVGLRGNSTADFNNRLVATTATWATSSPGTLNTSSCAYSATLVPVSGQVYQWDPNIQPIDAGVSALINPLTSGCYGSSENMVVTINNYGSTSLTNIPVTIVVSGAATQTSNATFTGTLAPMSSTNFTVATLNMSAAGNYTFNAFTSMPGDGTAANDAMAQATRTVIAPSALPQAVSFTGFTGTNLTTVFPLWRESTGATVPAGTTSGWTSQTGLNGVGNITARLNLYTTTRNEWIVGPKFNAAFNSQLTFDAAITAFGALTTYSAMGSDDKVRVMVSTDCGVSYTPIYTISATNSLTTSFTNFAVSLGAYAGQDIIVAFLAQDGPTDDTEDYDFHLDNINILNAIPADAGVSAMTSPLATGCYSANENVVVTIDNNGTSAITNIPVTVIVSGAVSQTINATYTGTINPSASANFTVGLLNMTTAGTYTFNAFSSLAGDGNAFNDAMAQTTRTVIASSPLPQIVSFTGYTGANLTTVFPLWRESTGATVPAGITSGWTSQTGLNGAGNITARLNLYTTSRNEWIVGPKISATANTQLSFDAAITGFGALTTYSAMGSDDKVRVMVSTDCGVSYTPIFTVSATNSLTTSFTNFVVSLGAYAGQDIIVAFLAQDGPTDDAEDYDFHLDNINIMNASASDAGVSAMTSPAVSGCYSANENVVVTLNNYGVAAISNIPVTVIVSGAVSQTLNATYTGTIAPSATASFTVGTLNMSTAGTYTFNASTSLAGDANTFNDAMAQTTRVVVATSTLPQLVSFTGYTGANLSTPFPLWSEATGSVVPGGTTSTWTSQTGLNGVGNVTARINLLAVSKADWILGPKFTATSSSQLTFDAAITGAGALTTYSAMGSDDMVRVMVSTDCGASYAPVFTVSATNSLTSAFTNYVVSLSAYAGQDIIVGFLATDGPVNDVESYDFHLDNINIYNPVSNDAGVTALVTPGTIGCYGASENVAVTINNYGSNAISNIPVTVIVSGAVSQTINATYTGTIAPSATANFTVGTLNMTTAGTYSFDASTGLAGDGNTSNDNMIQVTRTQVAPVSVPQSVSFTGFTGANLTTVFPNWIEAAGSPNPGGTTSLWTSQTGLNGVGNITARLNLYTTTRNEWIVGPKITAGSSSQITFDAAVTDWNSTTVAAAMGSDDMVRVMVSTDCGVTYAPVFTVSATNSLSTTFTNFTVSLGAYAGQDIIVAFFATDGPVNDTEDYDFHLDNINICTTPSAPASPIAAGICTGTTATISSGTVTGTPYWYNVPTGGSVVSTSTVYTTPTLTANTTYYIADSTGCGIGPRTPVTVTVSPIPSLTVTTSDTVLCLGNTATLTVTGATTYSWTGVGSGSSVVVTPTATTVYTVTGSNTGCDASATINQVVSACTGIDNTLMNSNGINLFPNPTQSNITVVVSNMTGPMWLEVYDAIGKKIITKSLNANNTTLSLSDLESGIYVYKINDVNGAVKVGKIVKE